MADRTLGILAVVLVVALAIVGIRIFYNPSAPSNPGTSTQTQNSGGTSSTSQSSTTTQSTIATSLSTSTTTTTTTTTSTTTTSTTQPSTPGKYIVLAWNDLGMHCYNPDFSNIGILPPYNTLWAQVIRVGNPPQIVTEGIVVEYSFPDNTYSAGNPSYANKTNFWNYAQKLFGVKLQANVGLTGRGLSGTMTAATDHFIAEGIPLTEFTDTTAKGGAPSTWVADPWQQALIVVKDAATGTELCRTPVTAPVSTEINCGNCHSDSGEATKKYPITPTGNVDTNILTLHDYLNAATFASMGLQPLMDSRPVLCASCHSSNALGAAGKAGVKSLSNAVHGHHASLTTITPDTNGCYNCHPGPKTQCLRDVMSRDEEGMTCINCHGTLSKVAQNSNPWLSEPRCDGCHEGSTQTQALYRFSVGHSGVYCEACHDSTHAIAPSREAIDDLKFVLLQGDAETLRKCTVCHSVTPSGQFKHTK